MSNPKARLGAVDGLLATCPSSPNCVSSQAKEADAQHFIEALSFSEFEVDLEAEILSIIEHTRGMKLEKSEPNYFHIVCITLIMRFKDDLEILIDPKAQLVHFRSASRVGYSDFGVNRKRVENFKLRLKAFIESSQN
ncbi:MAG: DUF1499 domain-containing protein [Lentisphaeraceae bacterium]|nr:DUF1499 domain-containing protein [Lentisphaeraceae bacterium]